MKWLIILMLAVACGKHEMPGEKDLADNDGDQTPNYLEISDFDKNVADVTPFGEVAVDMRFRINSTGLENRLVQLANDLDITKYSMDLMVKSLNLLQIEDYFSEFSVLRTKKDETFDQPLDEIYKVKLDILKVKNATDLYLIQRDEKIHLGNIKDSLEFSLTGEDIDRILRGEYSLALSNENIKKFAHRTQSQSIKEKTYRIFMDDGKSGKIFYVAKTYPFEKFLSHFGIKHASAIEEVSILTTAHPSAVQQWWVRSINSQDKVLVLRNLKTISEYYLKSFKRQNGITNRTNGKLTTSTLIQKNPFARAMFKFRVKATQREFRTFTKKDHYWIGRPADSGDRLECRNSYRQIISEKEIPVTKNQLKESLRFVTDGQISKISSLIQGRDEKGEFWETEVPLDSEKVELTLINLSEEHYLPVGLYATSCKGNSAPQLTKNFQAFEGRMDLQVEAFVENI